MTDVNLPQCLDRFYRGVYRGYLFKYIGPHIPPRLQYALIFIPGLVAGRIFDMGLFRIPLLLASIAVVAATFLIAECKEYWQFLLCQGFAVGVRTTDSIVRTWIHF